MKYYQYGSKTLKVKNCKKELNMLDEKSNN